MTLNPKNIIENLIYIIVTAVAVGFTVNYTTTRSMEKAFEIQKEIIKQAIEKNTNEISNTFQTELKNVKNKKGESINIIIDPTSNSVLSDADSSQTINVKSDKGWFKRLFNRE